jgi:hypothetical protein
MLCQYHHAGSTSGGMRRLCVRSSVLKASSGTYALWRGQLLQCRAVVDFGACLCCATPWLFSLILKQLTGTDDWQSTSAQH